MKIRNQETGEIAEWNPDTGDVTPIPQEPQQAAPDYEKMFEATYGMTGPQQALYGATVAPFETAAGLGQLTGTVAPETIQGVQQAGEVARGTLPGMAGNIPAHILTAMGPGMGLKAAGLAAQSPRLAAAGSAAMAPTTLPGAAAAGGIYSAIQPGTPEERAVAGGLGAAGGFAGGAIGRGIGAALGPKTVRPEALALEAQGVPLKLSQRSDSQALKWMDAAFESLPLTSGPQQRLTDASQKAFNRAVLSRAGVKADEATEEVMNQAYDRFDDIYTRFTKGREITLGDEFLDDIAKVEVSESTLFPSTRSPEIQQVIKDATDLAERGKIASESLQAERSIMAKNARSARRAGNNAQAEGYEALVDALDNALERELPQKAKEQLATARAQYSVMKTLEKVGIDEGNISPARLANRLKVEDRKGYLTGRGPLMETAKAGKAVLPAAPSSGTAQRALYQNLAQGGLGAGVGGGVGALAGQDVQSAGTGAIVGLAGPRALRSTMYSPIMQRILTEGLMGKSTTDILRGISTYAGAGIGRIDQD